MPSCFKGLGGPAVRHCTQWSPVAWPKRCQCGQVLDAGFFGVGVAGSSFTSRLSLGAASRGAQAVGSGVWASGCSGSSARPGLS